MARATARVTAMARAGKGLAVKSSAGNKLAGNHPRTVFFICRCFVNVIFSFVKRNVDIFKLFFTAFMILIVLIFRCFYMHVHCCCWGFFTVAISSFSSCSFLHLLHRTF